MPKVFPFTPICNVVCSQLSFALHISLEKVVYHTAPTCERCLGSMTEAQICLAVHISIRSVQGRFRAAYNPEELAPY